MYPDFVKEAESEGNKAAQMSFTFAMKAEEVHAGLYQEALENLATSQTNTAWIVPARISSFIRANAGRSAVIPLAPLSMYSTQFCIHALPHTHEVSAAAFLSARHPQAPNGSIAPRAFPCYPAFSPSSILSSVFPKSVIFQ